MASVWASSLVCDQCGSDSSRDGVRLGGPAASPASSCAAGSRVSIRREHEGLIGWFWEPSPDLQESGYWETDFLQLARSAVTWEKNAQTGQHGEAHGLDALFEDECHENKTEHALTARQKRWGRASGAPQLLVYREAEEEDFNA
ncbi:hypothetical protein EJB05_29308, partial [Eragrostis curvula]